MRIKLSNNKVFDILLDNFVMNHGVLTAQIIPGTENILAIEEMFQDANNTKKIYLMDDPDVISPSDTEEAEPECEVRMVVSGFVKLMHISKDSNIAVGYEVDNFTPIYKDIVTIKLEKESEIEKKQESIETQVTDMQMALCDIYESMGV